jgi:outer membrane autotransporter protein
MNKIEYLEYKKSSLVAFFIEYSKCHNNELINFESKQKRDLFNLIIRPRINSSSLTIVNSYYDSKSTAFGNKMGFGFGLEAEFILPYNKNKWAIVIEPTYQSYKSKKTSNVFNISGGILIAEVNYSSIEIPVSLRHYLFLNNNSKIFINASYIFDFSSKSSIEFKRSDNSNLDSLDIKTRPNLGIGLGYKQNDKYSLEIRYQTGRNVLSNYNVWRSEYKSLSIIFGYSLF